MVIVYKNQCQLTLGVPQICIGCIKPDISRNHGNCGVNIENILLTSVNYATDDIPPFKGILHRGFMKVGKASTSAKAITLHKVPLGKTELELIPYSMINR